MKGSSLFKSAIRIALLAGLTSALLVSLGGRSSSAPVAPATGQSGGPLAEPPGSAAGLQVFLPLIQVAYPPAPLPLGKVVVIAGAQPCEQGQCYELEVSCPEISRSERATLMVGGPNGPAARGTVLFASGWTGSYPWAYSEVDFKQVEQAQVIPSEATLGSNRAIIDTLRTAGFRTVQIVWARNWFEAERGHAEGMANLACKPATVTRWVYDNLHDDRPTTAFCATGHSNGASQFAYGLTFYGVADLLDYVVLESGPNWSRIDAACIKDDDGEDDGGDGGDDLDDLYAEDGERRTIDWGFGFASDGSGPCARSRTAYRSQFQAASVAYGLHTYKYPHTKILFLFGEEDETTTRAQGEVFYDTLKDSGSPWIERLEIDDADHFVTDSPEGAAAMQNALLNDCLPR